MIQSIIDVDPPLLISQTDLEAVYSLILNFYHSVSSTVTVTALYYLLLILVLINTIIVYL